VLSVLPAIPVALAFRRRSFWGRTFLIKIFSTTLVMPVLVGVFGIIAIYGHSGLVSKMLQWLDLPFDFSIYGLNGILLAHVFFNLPYASRLFLHSLETIPDEQELLACHLGMAPWSRFRWIEWPRMYQQLPHISGLVFMLCFTSFATVMALGGGPRATTIELAIYQAIKFDFDLQSGALLALWQVLLCGALSFILQSVVRPIEVGNGGITYQSLLYRDGLAAKCWDIFWIGISGLIVIPPLVMVCLSGLNVRLLEVLSGAGFWESLGHSFLVALVASCVALGAGVCLLMTSRGWRLFNQRKRADLLETIGMIILVTPGLVMSTGLFLLLRAFTDAFAFAYVVVVLVNAMIALPYVMKTLQQPMWVMGKQYEYLCSSLGLKGWRRFLMIEWRAIRKPIVHAGVISFLVSMGDLSAIALFGSTEFRTLPLYLYQLIGSYQMPAAAVVAFCMLGISVGCFFIADRLFDHSGGHNA
jgi:thiamine transport system permease protein